MLFNVLRPCCSDSSYPTRASFVAVLLLAPDDGPFSHTRLTLEAQKQMRNATVAEACGTKRQQSVTTSFVALKTDRMQSRVW